MFGFKKKSGSPDSLFTNAIFFGTLICGLAQLMYNTFSDANKFTMSNNNKVSVTVIKNALASAACGGLGCFDMKNTTFLIGDDAQEWVTGPPNMTVNYTDTVQLNCTTYTDSYMLYWIGFRDRDLHKNNESYVNLTGYYYQNNDTLDQRHQITLENVTGYDQRYFACILVKNNTAAISYGFLEVLDDPNKDHYNYEKFDLTNSTSSPNDAASGLSGEVGAMIAAAGALILGMIAVVGFAAYRRRSNSVIVKYWLKKVTVETPESETGDLVMPIVRIEKQRLTQVGILGNDTTLMSEYQMPVDTKWEIPRSKISLTGQMLGEGEFGKVVKAEACGVVSEDVKTVVAVKMLKDGYTDDDMIALVSEMEIMKMIGKHENIINLLGCCTQDGPLYVVVEFAHNGSLRDHLKRHRPHKNNGSTENLLSKPLAQTELMGFVWQVAKGMEYLASRGCIHRDLAARNVLVSEDGVLKIADFGLARDVRDSDYYRKRTAGKLPMKWMAPESISLNYYDKRSDVWSFGVISWEIMTYGSVPYASVSVFKLYHHLENNHRLEKPADCTNELYNMMKSCWEFKPEDRPTFEEIVITMKNILNLPDSQPPPQKQNEYVTMLS